MSQPRIRRDVRALSTAERARFFYCLKMLDILPPREANNLRVFYISYFDWEWGQQVRIRPKNIHDQFIASHQTTCQHGSPYFAYYHRHLTICMEIAINYAEEVLLGGSKAVPNNMFSLNQNQWNAVFTRYQSIIASFRQEKNLGPNDPLPQLALHYWNPTDYTQNIVIPPELSNRVPDQIDNLYFAINQHYAWNFNFQNRWFNNNSIPEDFISNGYFSQNQTFFNQNQQNILNGTLNPRTQPLNFFTSAVVSNDFGSFDYSLNDTIGQLNAYRNYQQFTQTGNTISVCTLQQNQIDAVFGSKKKQLHWVSQAERNQMDPTSRDNAYIYNKFLPHFQYAYSLMKGGTNFMPDYVTTSSSNFEYSMQNCHNTMHNNLQLFMSDAQLSITNLLFFLYHSWIDLALETKIRMIRNSDRNESQLLSTIQYLNNIKPASPLDQPSGQPGNITYADYNIYQWAIPAVRDRWSEVTLQTGDYQIAFRGIDFVVNGSIGIRRSDEINTFYQQNYIPNNGSRYSYFNGFKNFIYDYNYEIIDYNQNDQVSLVVMQGNVVPIPSYILAIAQDYQSLWDNNLTRSTAVDTNPVKDLKVESKQRGSIRFPDLDSPLCLSAPENQLTVQAYYDMKYLLRAIRVTLAGYGRFSSKVKSTVVPIAIQLTQQGYKQLVLNKKHFKALKKGVVFTFYPIFSRGNGAQVCPNCKPEKEIWISCSEHLAELNPEFFCSLMGCLNQEIFYEIVKNQCTVIKPIKICDLLRLTSSKPILKTLKLLEGAVEVSFKVNFSGKQDYKTSRIKINGFSYSVQNDQLFNIISKKKQNLNCEIQLAQVIGLNEKSNHHRYVYKLIKVFILNGSEHREFQFEIHTYHDLIRFEIDIRQREGDKGRYLDVTVRDRDFAFKQNHYKLECYEV